MWGNSAETKKINNEIENIKENCKVRNTALDKICDKIDKLTDALHSFVVDMSNITSIHQEKFKEVEKTTKSLEQSFTEKLQSIDHERKLSEESIYKEIDNTKEHLSSELNIIKTKVDNIDKTINAINKYKWFIIGGLVVIYITNGGNISHIIMKVLTMLTP